MRRKLIKITAAAGMAVVLLSGCGSGGNYTPSNAGSSDGQTDGSATSNKEEELQAEIDALQQEIDDLKNGQQDAGTDNGQADNGQTDTQAADNGTGQTGGSTNRSHHSSGNSSSAADTLISIEDAQNIALDRVPGATGKNISIELDRDDGWYIYEGDIHYDGMEYEFEIDAESGNILKWEEERW